MKFPFLFGLLALPVCAFADSQNSSAPQSDGPSSIRPYKQVNGRELTLHVFDPSSATAAPRPAVLLIHSGGWTNNGPESYYKHARALRDMGFVVACVQYRLARPPSTVRNAVADTQDAMRHLRAHAAELRIDPARIVACGGSAGAHLAASLALFPEVTGATDSDTLRPAALVLFNPVIDTSPEGYGNNKLGENWRAFSPVHQVKADAPPTILFHGTDDRTTPFAGADAFHAAMIKLGNRCDFHPNQGGDHGYYNQEPLYSETMNQVRAFLIDLGILSPSTTDHPAAQS